MICVTSCSGFDHKCYQAQPLSLIKGEGPGDEANGRPEIYYNNAIWFCLSSIQTHESEMIPPVDPSVLLDLEVLSAKLGRDHAHMMDNLRTSLHAVSACHYVI